MPAQDVRVTSTVAYYKEGDTAPALRRQMQNPDGSVISLEDADTVTIAIAWSSPHGSYYTSPRNRIVSDGPCIIEAGTDGWVNWWPQPGDLGPPGQFNYEFTINWNNDTHQIVASNTYDPLIIRSQVGGRAWNDPPILGP